MSLAEADARYVIVMYFKLRPSHLMICSATICSSIEYRLARIENDAPPDSRSFSKLFPLRLVELCL